MLNFIRLIKNILICLLCGLVLSCQPRPAYKAPSKFFKNDLKNASPDFKQGWQDGCEVGMVGGNNNFNQMFYKNNKVDGFKMAYSTEYRTAWNYAFWFCYRTDAIDEKSTPYSSLFKGYM